MSTQQTKPPKTLLIGLAHWSVLGSIAWATYAQPSYGSRLLELAGIWLGIVNTLILLLLTISIFSKAARDAVQVSRQKFSRWRKAHNIILHATELVVFAWAGFLWCFGIRLVSILIQEIIFTKPDST